MRLTRQYADALFMALPSAESVNIYHQARRVKNILKQIPEFVTLIDFRPKEFKHVREIMEGKFPPLLINFLEVLAYDGLLHRFSTILKDFQLILIEENLFYQVKVYSALTLTEAAKDKLESLINKRWGQNYLIAYYVDKKVLGGIRLEVNGAIIDTTFRSRIDQIVREVQHGTKG